MSRPETKPADVNKCDGCGQYFSARELFRHVANDLQTLWLCDRCTPDPDANREPDAARGRVERAFTVCCGDPEEVEAQIKDIIGDKATIAYKLTPCIAPAIKPNALGGITATAVMAVLIDYTYRDAS